MVASISEQQDSMVLTIPRHLIDDEFFLRLKAWVDYLNLVDSSALPPEEAWRLSEEVKSAWWAANRERILQKIGATA